MRSNRKKLVEYPPASTASSAKLFAPKNDATSDSASDLMDHNIGATMKLCAMLLRSWIKSPGKQGNESPVITVTIPGSKTDLSYNPAERSVCISDELHQFCFEKGKTYPRSSFPNPTDPRIASVLFCLLEETHDGELETLIPSLEMHTTEWVFRDQDQKALDHARFKEMVKDGVITSETLPENFIPKITMYALKVSGEKDILKLIDALERAFLRHKGRVIPLEKGAEKSLIRTL